LYGNGLFWVQPRFKLKDLEEIFQHVRTLRESDFIVDLPPQWQEIISWLENLRIEYPGVFFPSQGGIIGRTSFWAMKVESITWSGNDKQDTRQQENNSLESAVANNASVMNLGIPQE